MSVVYVCEKCGASGVKLWRQAQTFADHAKLRCRACATVEQAAQIEAYAAFSHPSRCTIGDLLPAVPTVEMDTYWGYTSVPEDRLQWWRDLPDARLSPETVATIRDALNAMQFGTPVLDEFNSVYPEVK